MVLKGATTEPKPKATVEQEFTLADRLAQYRTHIFVGVAGAILLALAVYIIVGLGREREQTAWYETRDVRNQAYVALSMGDAKEAERALRELEARIDDYDGTSVHPVLLFLKGLLLETTDRLEDALATLETLQKRYPEHPLVNPAHYAPGDTPPALVALQTIRANLEFYRRHGRPFNKRPRPAPDLRAVLHVKGYGTITLGFFPEYAPKHVANFLRLAREGFYDGTQFHRITDFCIQGGDPNSKDEDPRNDGQGGPGYTVPKEIYLNPILHKRGTLSAAAQSPSGPDEGSQFFICTRDKPELDGQYTPFGEVLEGMDVVDKISLEATEGPNEKGIPPDHPTKPIVIQKILVQGEFSLPRAEMPGPPPGKATGTSSGGRKSAPKKKAATPPAKKDRPPKPPR